MRWTKMTEEDDADQEDMVDEEDPEEFDDSPETASYFNSSFDQPALQNAHRLRSTPFKDEAKQYIKYGNLYPRAKRALRAFIDNFLSEMTLLSNFKDVDAALLDFDIAIIRMVPNFYPSDRRNPFLDHVLELLRSHVKAMFGRATGADRERLLNMRQTVETRQVKMDDIGKIKVNQPKQKSILSGLTG